MAQQANGTAVNLSGDQPPAAPPQPQPTSNVPPPVTQPNPQITPDMNPRNQEIMIEMTSPTSAEIEAEMNPLTETQISPSTSTEIVSENETTTSPVTQMEINIHELSPTRPLPPTRQPSLSLLDAGERYFYICVPLYTATVTGNWDAVNVLLSRNRERDILSSAITEDYDTVLHVAAASAENSPMMIPFFKKLVAMMDDKDLYLQNKDSDTALCLAAASGNLEMAIILTDHCSGLLGIRGREGMLPLYVAAAHGRDSIVRRLYKRYGVWNSNIWTDEDRGKFVERCVESDFFDIALEVLLKYPNCIMNSSILRTLAGKPEALYITKGSFFKKLINSGRTSDQDDSDDHHDSDALKILKLIFKKTIETNSKENFIQLLNQIPRNAASTNVISSSATIPFVAAEAGNTRFVVELFLFYPDQICQVNAENQTIFHIAIKHRHQGIYNLLYKMGTLRDKITRIIDSNGNNMLHLVGLTSQEMRPDMCEASLIMQRELLWFEAVEKMLPPSMRKLKNDDQKTPYELFKVQNEDVVSEGLKWVKHCMVVATLIVTVMFAVAFTVPGGYDQSENKDDLGFPIFYKRSTFLIFVIADAVSLFSSTASLLLFLFILVTRYNQRHFSYTLPKKLMFALFLLFFSVVAMMVTFGASFFVLYHREENWVPFLISALVAIPVIIFATLQIPFLWDIFRSMFDKKYLFNPRNHMLYNTKLR